MGRHGLKQVPVLQWNFPDHYYEDMHRLTYRKPVFSTTEVLIQRRYNAPSYTRLSNGDILPKTLGCTHIVGIFEKRKIPCDCISLDAGVTLQYSNQTSRSMMMNLVTFDMSMLQLQELEVARISLRNRFIRNTWSSLEMELPSLYTHARCTEEVTLYSILNKDVASIVSAYATDIKTPKINSNGYYEEEFKTKKTRKSRPNSTQRKRQENKVQESIISHSLSYQKEEKEQSISQPSHVTPISSDSEDQKKSVPFKFKKTKQNPWKEVIARKKYPHC
jgi:RecG-like helicase